MILGQGAVLRNPTIFSHFISLFHLRKIPHATTSPLPTPAGFGTPLQISIWKSARPRWMQAVQQALIERLVLMRLIALSAIAIPIPRLSFPVAGLDPICHPLTCNDGGPSAESTLALQALSVNDTFSRQTRQIFRSRQLRESFPTRIYSCIE